MRHATISVAAIIFGALLALPLAGDTIYNNLTPNNQMAIASRPDAPGAFEIETGDDGSSRGRIHPSLQYPDLCSSARQHRRTLTFNNAFPSVSNPVTGPIQMYHLGLWFNSPNDAATSAVPIRSSRLTENTTRAFKY